LTSCSDQAASTFRKRSASAIAEGAAWVAHDQARLHLAKNVELGLARNSYMPLLQAGGEMPLEREHRRERFDLYCVDPSDGHGKFSLVSPHRPGPRVLANDKRRPLCNMLLKVDGKAAPFRERLELEVSIDENLVLTATAWSMNQKGRAVAEVHDLEFALATPGARTAGSTPACSARTTMVRRMSRVTCRCARTLRRVKTTSLVPGEVLYRLQPVLLPRRAEPAADSGRGAAVLRTLRHVRPCVQRPACHCASLLASAAPRREKAELHECDRFNRLAELLTKAAAGNSHTAAAAVAVLWTDKDRQWEPAVGRLRQPCPAF
jgi:molecular chaperone DnaK